MGPSGLKMMSGMTAHILHQQGLIDLNRFTKHKGRYGHRSSSKQLTGASPTSSTPPPNQIKRPVLKTACMNIYSKNSLMMREEKTVGGPKKIKVISNNQLFELDFLNP